MLTLLPLSGIQDVFKRRNSTTMEQFTDRRGSISVYDTYSLPSSKADMRRFSSYEQLAPFFQQILSQDGVVGRPAATPAPAPVPNSPSTASNSSGTSPTVPSPLVRSRRGSIGRFASALTGSFRRQKSAAARPVSESESDVSCDDLDTKLAEIKGKLVSVNLQGKIALSTPSLHTQPYPSTQTLQCPIFFPDRPSSSRKMWTYPREWRTSPAQWRTSMSAHPSAALPCTTRTVSTAGCGRRR